MTFRQMPSPRGTNHARLFIEAGPLMALDEAMPRVPGGVRREGNPLSRDEDSAVTRLQAVINRHVPESEREEAHRLIAKALEEAERLHDDADEREELERLAALGRTIEEKGARRAETAMDNRLSQGTRTMNYDTLKAELRAAAQAREDVRPVIGAVSMALDDAAAIYRLALDHLHVDVTDVPRSAYAALLKAHRQHARRQSADGSAALALDIAASTGLAKKFPGVARIRHA